MIIKLILDVMTIFDDIGRFWYIRPSIINNSKTIELYDKYTFLSKFCFNKPNKIIYVDDYLIVNNCKDDIKSIILKEINNLR
jgi:hypothetical protein